MWYYNGVPFDGTFPEGTVGFCYLITHLPTGKKYIGRKLITSAKTKTVKGKRKKYRVASDWESYWSSSKDIQQMVKDEGEDAFKREILIFLNSKGELLYAEENLLHHFDVLTSEGWFNNNIRSRIYRSWVKREGFADDLKRVKSS